MVGYSWLAHAGGPCPDWGAWLGLAGGNFGFLGEELSDLLPEQSKVNRLLQEVGHREPFAIDIFVAESERELLVDGGEHENGDGAEIGGGSRAPVGNRRSGSSGKMTSRRMPVGPALFDLGEGVFGGVDDEDFMPQALANRGHGTGEVRVVIDDKQVGHKFNCCVCGCGLGCGRAARR